ncbi:MAG TPA: dTMP kinase [Bacteroidetes bacterium]|uniref:Thymidylate kinase n=1 Tax=candidate division TA06 bacterium TaxID=2250710 RepID=A0A660S5D6_UNCT6|nr:MAG: dTMP kinase [candidate division TA06 bacterium]HHD82548.1 dTMP kinase [Bacteroidota bacterium]
MKLLSRGFFISFEGGEASGKSTQAKKLYEYLKAEGFPVVLTHEPGGTDISERIRQILLDKDNLGMCALTELFLYFASRAQHVFEVIKPALKENKIVISDRYHDSTMAYQGEGRGVPKVKIKEMNDFATSGIIPDITFLIDVPPQVALKRLEQFDRIEREDIEFHKRVRSEYLQLARENEKRFVIIDGMADIETIFEQIKEKVNDFIVSNGVLNE